ncbi:MAG: YihY/virulence factor BrkB family protein [Chloroflexota bacterium]
MNRLRARLLPPSLVRFANRVSEDRLSDGAILIAWQALFSIFPLIFGILSVAGLLLRDPRRAQSLKAAVEAAFPSQVSDLLGFIDQTRDFGGLLGVIGLASLLWSGAGLFGAITKVMNRLHRTPDRSFLRQKVTEMALMMAYLILITLSVSASGATTFLVGVSGQILPFDLPNSAFLLGWLLSLASAFLMFFVVYHFAPNATLAFRDIWPGAATSAFLFVVLSQVFPIYLRLTANGLAAYRALGIFLLLMTWFYALSFILVVGAALNVYLREARSTEPEPEPAPPIERGPSVGKLALWAATSAVTTTVVVAVFRRGGEIIWRVAVGEPPPRKA